MRIDYKKLSIYCMRQGHFRRSELLAIIDDFALADIRDAESLSMQELYNLIEHKLITSDGWKIRMAYEYNFGLSPREANEFFQISLTEEDYVRLASNGRLSVAETKLSKMTGWRYRTYTPESVAKLSDEELSHPDLPAEVTQKTQL